MLGRCCRCSPSRSRTVVRSSGKVVASSSRGKVVQLLTEASSGGVVVARQYHQSARPRRLSPAENQAIHNYLDASRSCRTPSPAGKLLEWRDRTQSSQGATRRMPCPHTQRDWSAGMRAGHHRQADGERHAGELLHHAESGAVPNRAVAFFSVRAAHGWFWRHESRCRHLEPGERRGSVSSIATFAVRESAATSSFHLSRHSLRFPCGKVFSRYNYRQKGNSSRNRESNSSCRRIHHEHR